MVSKQTFTTLIFGVLFLLVIFFLIIFFQIKFTTGKNGAALMTSQATFFIPSRNPTRIYAFPIKPQMLAQQIQDIIKDSNSTFGIYIKNLTTNQEVTINEDLPFKSASLYKLGLMYVIFKKGEQGKLDINNPTISENLDAMITVSSNDAAFYLINNFSSWNELNDTMHELGLNNTNFADDPLTTTPRDMERLLELMANGQAVSKNDSLKMLEIMNRQQINDRIPLLLPSKVVIAHKTGEIDDVRHDVGILGDENNDYILVLMSKNSTDPESVKPLMAKISQTVYQYFKNQWQTSPEIL